MSVLSGTEDRVCSALREVAATTTTQANAWERISARTPDRGRLRRSPMLAAAVVLVCVATGVAVAVSLGTGDSRGSVVAGRGSLPTGGGEIIGRGDFGGGHSWVLSAVRTGGGALDVELRAGTTVGHLGRLDVGRLNVDRLDLGRSGPVVVAAVHGGNDSLTYVFGAVPAESTGVRVSTTAGVVAVRAVVPVVGDPARFGARFFVTFTSASVSTQLRIEALGAADRVLGSSSLPIHGLQACPSTPTRQGQITSACRADGTVVSPLPEVTATSAPRAPTATAPGIDGAAYGPVRTTAGVHAVVPGGPGGAAPCAPPPDGTSGADTAHPQRAPLQQSATFAAGARWAICGASLSNSADLLNLRSTDQGKTWTVTDTGLRFNPSHAGDQLSMTLGSPTAGQIHIRSTSGQFDGTYATTDAGLSWTLIATSDAWAHS